MEPLVCRFSQARYVLNRRLPCRRSLSHSDPARAQSRTRECSVVWHSLIDAQRCMWLATETLLFSQSLAILLPAHRLCLKAVPRKVDRRGNLPITGWPVINGVAFTNLVGTRPRQLPRKSLAPYRERSGRQRPRQRQECTGPERSRYGDL
jgi:hypothetical protein